MYTADYSMEEPTPSDLCTEMYGHLRLESSVEESDSETVQSRFVQGVSEVGKATTGILEICGLFNVESYDVECRLTSVLTNKMEGCVVTELDRGRYEIAYQPTTPGLHILEVKVNGRPVRGSPFAVRVKRPIDKLGDLVRVIVGVHRPWGVAVNKAGELVVCETSKQCAAVFSSSGKKLKNLKMSLSLCFREIRGLALDQDENIIVTGDCELVKMSQRGRLLKQDYHGNNGLSFPHGFIYDVAVNHWTHEVYAINNSSHQVQVFDSDLKLVQKFKCFSPYSIALDSHQNVYIVSFHAGCIQVFTPGGALIREFGEGILSGPVSICIDSEDILYVGELDRQCVTVLTTEGQVLKTFGSKGCGPGQFLGPYGIAVDECGVLYVCDYGNNRIQVF